MDSVKRSFDKVKEDMDSLRYEMDSIKSEIRELRDSMVDICEIVNNLQKNNSQNDLSHAGEGYQEPTNSPKTDLDKPTDTQTDTSTHSSTGFSTPSQPFHSDSAGISTQEPVRQTNSTDNSTDNSGFSPQNPQNFSISTRNQGVPTDKQTNRQTNRQTGFSPVEGQNSPQTPTQDSKSSFDNAVGILDSLDNIKKDLRLKFKRLTHQEFLVFSTLYQLTDQHGSSDYKTLSKKLNLSGSSIRDYVGRLIEKGVPVEKNRVNNKNIQLNVSSELKKIASLPTIMELRDI